MSELDVVRLRPDIPTRSGDSSSGSPHRQWKMEDLRLPDGTPMVGPDGFLIPQAREFTQIVNAASRVYSYRWDEAMRDNFVNARAMLRDSFIWGLLQERILPTVNRTWRLEVDDEADPYQVHVRDSLTRVIQRIKDFDAMRWAFMMGSWWGRGGNQWTFARIDDLDGAWGIGKFDPLHGDSIQFTYDGVPAILLDSMTTGWYAQHGAKWGVDLRWTDRGGTALVLQRPYWRERFGIYQHFLQKADYFEGELAGSVQGLGLRGLVYLQYVVRSDALTWMLTYMQAVGMMDLLVFNYPAGNDAAKRQQELNAQSVVGKAAIICPRNPNGNWPAVEQIPMNAAGLKALQALVADYFDRNIERVVVGQSMSSGGGQMQGLGDTGRAELAKSCVPVEGSEILTRRGFVSPHDAIIGEDVLAYDADADECRWTPLLKKSFYEDCEVVRMFTGQNKFEAICTSDHSWAVEKTKYACDYKRKIHDHEIVEGVRGASKLAEQKRYLKKASEIRPRENIVLAAPEKETTENLLTPTEAAVLGWIVTDGTIRKIWGKRKGTRYSIGICQSKEEYFQPIRELVHAFAGKPLHETVVETKQRTFPMNGKTYATKPQRWWYLPREAGSDLIAKCGFESRADLPGIVTRLSSPARRAMLEAMMMAEGSKYGTGSVFVNSDPHVNEAFDILCALEGVATGKARGKKIDPRYSECFMKSVKTSRHAYGTYIQLENAGRADIWCPTTKYGTWVMRQNGRVMITGNTKDEILIFDTNRHDNVLTYDMVSPLKRYNFPKARFPVRFKSVMPDLEAAEKVQNGLNLISVSVPIKVDEIREAAGYSRPEEGDETVGSPEPMIPNALPPGGGMPGPGGALPLNAGNVPDSGMPQEGGPIPLSRNPWTAMPTPFMGTSSAMGFPGGSNTYIPQSQWFGKRKPGQTSPIGFTRYVHPYGGIVPSLNKPVQEYPKVTVSGDVIHVDTGERRHRLNPGDALYGEWIKWVAANRDKVFWRSVSDPSIIPQRGRPYLDPKDAMMGYRRQTYPFKYRQDLRGNEHHDNGRFTNKKNRGGRGENTRKRSISNQMSTHIWNKVTTAYDKLRRKYGDNYARMIAGAGLHSTAGRATPYTAALAILYRHMTGGKIESGPIRNRRLPFNLNTEAKLFLQRCGIRDVVQPQ